MLERNEIISQFDELRAQTRSSLRRHMPALKSMRKSYIIISLTAAIMEGIEETFRRSIRKANKDLADDPVELLSRDPSISDYLFPDGGTSVIITEIESRLISAEWGMYELSDDERAAMVDSAIVMATHYGAAFATELGYFTFRFIGTGPSTYLKIWLNERN